MFINNHVYICNLLSITPEIEVDVNATKAKNIKKAKTVKVKSIMVQFSPFSGLVCREVITQKMIPVMRHSEGLFHNEIGCSVPSVPCFIEYTRRKEFNRDMLLPRYVSYIWEASPNQLKDYIESHTSPDGTYDDYSKELDDIFAKAEEYYNVAYSKALEQSKTSTRSLIRGLRRKQNI